MICSMTVIKSSAQGSSANIAAYPVLFVDHATHVANESESDTPFIHVLLTG